jgi:hypothetical protein
MMPKTLKRTLTQSIRMIDYDFMCLDLSTRSTSSLELRQLEALGMNIERLQLTLEGLPSSQDACGRRIRHELRQQISIISTRTQLLGLKYKDRLEADALVHLSKILVECEHMIEVLEKLKQAATQGLLQ